MNIKECYDKAGANYEDALNRLGSDMLVECFALKFLQDDSFKQLTDGLAENHKVEECYNKVMAALQEMADQTE